MTLEERYNAAGNESYVGRVKSFQAADAGAIDGVNFLDGKKRTKTLAPDEYQTEIKRNAEKSFLYDAPGKNGKVPGSDADETGVKGLSNWTTSALDFSFKKSGTLISLHEKFKGFKSSSPTKWTGQQNYHLWTRDTTWVNGLQVGAKSRVTGASAGPSPAGING